ncbi:hypothetical protein KEM55_004750 [Ascosphaera atra]|nr:hypothetical protein KEM55_004750 [Ascosphaera atra]
MLPWIVAKRCLRLYCYDHVTDPVSFAETLKDLYLLIRRSPEILSFEYLEAQKPVRITCKNTSDEIKASPPRFDITSPDIEDVIRNSKKLKPEQPFYTKTQTDREFINMYWSSAVDDVLEDINDPMNVNHPRYQGSAEPSFWELREGISYDMNSRVFMNGLYRHDKTHWTSFIRDFILPDPGILDNDRRDYFLRGELLPIFAAFYGQMVHSQVNGDWDNDDDFYNLNFITPKLKYDGGQLTTTVVSFKQNHVRVVQASCDPSLNEDVVVHLNLRAHYILDYDTENGKWDKESVQDIMRWILFTPPYPEDIYLPTEKSSREAAKPD